MDVRQTEEIYKHTAQGDLVIRSYSPGSTDRRGTAGIVFFFGGGWIRGTIEQFHHQSLHLARRGMTAFTAAYRVRDQHGTMPLEAVADARSAVRWIRKNATRLGVDPERIATGGGSAGGHLAACTFFCEIGGDTDDDLEVSCTPDAMVLFNPVIDTTVYPGDAAEIGGPQLAVSLSPLHHVTPGAPPVLIMHGKDDAVIPIDNVRSFQQRMLAAGNRCRLEEYAGKGHGFFNYHADEKHATFAQTMAAAGEFLLELGFLPAAT